MDFSLTTTAFEEGQPIPHDYTGEGQDVSPPLKWFDPPRGTHSFALLCEDLDVPQGRITHWIIFNLPPVSRELSKGVPALDVLANGTMQGTNDFGRIGYNGPLPPIGSLHHYAFTLYALDRWPELPSGLTRICLKRQFAATSWLRLGSWEPICGVNSVTSLMTRWKKRPARTKKAWSPPRWT